MSFSSRMVKPSSLGSGFVVVVLLLVAAAAVAAARPKNMRRIHDDDEGREDPSAASDEQNEPFDSIISMMFQNSSDKRWACFVFL